MLKEQASEFEKFCNMLRENNNFALARFADGERLFIESKSARGIDGWVSPNSSSKLGIALRQALEISVQTGSYVGISDDTNDSQSKLFYVNLLKNVSSEKITLSNLFVNGTYSDFLSRFLPIIQQRNTVIICNYQAKPLELSLTFDKEPKYVYVPGDCLGFWERASSSWISHMKKIAKELTNHIFIFAAGPISSATIPLLWSEATDNTYIDVGSTLDPFLYGKYTRPYQQPGTSDSHQLSKLYIQDDIEEKPSDGITCIINCYKRWDGLGLIVNALKKQSKLPSEIHVLFNTTPPQKVLSALRSDALITNILCSDANLGVWHRFAYALNAKTEYICIFDDDTIPGNRWLENCLTCMQRREGLYGTVGLRLLDVECYMKHQRFGWPSQNTDVEEVDLVGHSWFFKREWLSSYWRDLPPVKGFEFMGEDMHMSYALQKYHALPTLVPPHPKNDQSLWGSVASQRGVDKYAISMTGKASRMDEAVKRLVRLGWKPLILTK
jgi:hypothetical protein